MISISLMRGFYRMIGNAVSGSSRLKLLTVGAMWLLKTLLALVFFASAAEKLSGQPMMVAEFDKIGLGQWFRYFTGSVELTGASLLLWPGTSFWGALALLSVCAGAGIAQLGPLHGDILHVIVLALLVLLAAWIARPSGERSFG